MPEPTWDDWAERHSTIFGLASDSDVAMLGEWTRLFASAGFTPREMMEASDNLALHDAPKYRSDHLRELPARARAARQARQPARTEAPSCGDCNLCGGVGRVIVPNRTLLAKGLMGTEAVLCRCPLGLWFRNQLLDLKPPTLEVYEMEQPDWRDIEKRHAEVRQREASANYNASKLDRTLGAIMGRIKAREANP